MCEAEILNEAVLLVLSKSRATLLRVRAKMQANFGIEKRRKGRWRDLKWKSLYGLSPGSSDLSNLLSLLTCDASRGALKTMK